MKKSVERCKGNGIMREDIEAYNSDGFIMGPSSLLHINRSKPSYHCPTYLGSDHPNTFQASVIHDVYGMASFR